MLTCTRRYFPTAKALLYALGSAKHMHHPARQRPRRVCRVRPEAGWRRFACGATPSRCVSSSHSHSGPASSALSATPANPHFWRYTSRRLPPRPLRLRTVRCLEPPMFPGRIGLDEDAEGIEVCGVGYLGMETRTRYGTLLLSPYPASPSSSSPSPCPSTFCATAGGRARAALGPCRTSSDDVRARTSHRHTRAPVSRTAACAMVSPSPPASSTFSPPSASCASLPLPPQNPSSSPSSPSPPPHPTHSILLDSSRFFSSAQGPVRTQSPQLKHARPLSTRSSGSSSIRSPTSAKTFALRAQVILRGQVPPLRAGERKAYACTSIDAPVTEAGSALDGKLLRLGQLRTAPPSPFSHSHSSSASSASPATPADPNFWRPPLSRVGCHRVTQLCIDLNRQRTRPGFSIGLGAQVLDPKCRDRTLLRSPASFVATSQYEFPVRKPPRPSTWVALATPPLLLSPPLAPARLLSRRGGGHAGLFQWRSRRAGRCGAARGYMDDHVLLRSLPLHP
ncbi:hypothetical protein C8R44DRAFT_327082 [Mycena epipterygia]|nr:hypothetical protein C8R44DRAFT_327082 [Mycena epipterygia]